MNKESSSYFLAIILNECYKPSPRCCLESQSLIKSSFKVIIFDISNKHVYLKRKDEVWNRCEWDSQSTMYYLSVIKHQNVICSLFYMLKYVVDLKLDTNVYISIYLHCKQEKK